MLRKIMWLPSLLSLFLTATVIASTEAIDQADGPEEKGLEIAKEMDRRDSGWGDQSAHLRMILRNRSGQESDREMRNHILEMEDDGDRSLLIFDNPPDVKGVVVLTLSHALEPDDQWLYLPSLKRIKRISSRNKSGPFMGSEFAYEDLSSQEVEKYGYEYLRDEVIDGRDTFVIKRSPRYKYFGYTHIISWVDKTMWQPIKLEFDDRKGDLLKTLRLLEYRQFLDRYWRSARMEMENHQTNKSTTLLWTGYRFQSGFTERDFERNRLKRVR